MSPPHNAPPTRWSRFRIALPKDHKRHLLAHLINEGNWHQVLVFTRTKHGANRLAEQLERAGIPSHAHPRQQEPERARARRWRTSRTTASSRWWPPKSRRAASTSRNCRTS